MVKAKSNKKTTPTVTEDTTISFETFRKIGDYEKLNLIQKLPSSTNGQICIRKYKITIEPIEESNEILAERLQKLWDECDNWHHVTPMANVAKEIGYELKGSFGTKRKKG